MRKLIIFILLFTFTIPSTIEAKVIDAQIATNAYSTSFPPNPYVQTPDWGIADTNVQKWWRQGYTGKGIKIAILDTGVDYTHPDLKGAIAGGVSFVSYTKSYMDDNSHGTHVAGIIAAQNNKIGSVGVAYGAKIYAVKVMDKNGQGNVTDLVKGVKWSIDHHMNIINMSLGLSYDEIFTPAYWALKYEISVAYKKGILIVAASGNDGVNQVNYPANFPDVIAVGGAYEDYNDVTRKISIGWASFSNYSSKIEVIAPSTFVYSTFPMNLTPFLNNYKGYDFMIGTSMASPYVCGFLAILKQKYPHDSVNMLRHRLHMNTIPVAPKGKTGYGFIYAKY